jgi:hypothetical protein
MDLKEIRWKGVEQLDLDQDMDKLRAVVNMAMNFWVP